MSRSKWRNIEVIPSLGFIKLRELNLDNNLITSFAVLGQLPLLGVLRLSHNRIDRIGDMDDDTGEDTPDNLKGVFTHLEVLHLGYNRIADITALHLESMPRLLAIDLQRNNITNLSGLNRCGKLVEVNLAGNKIRQLIPSAFHGLGNLRKLRLEDNGLRTLSSIASARSIQSLDLGQNRLSDPPELDKLGELPHLVELNIVGNPMARRSYSRLALLMLFPSLWAVDSVEITPEEKALAQQTSPPSNCRPTMLNSSGFFFSPTTATNRNIVMQGAFSGGTDNVQSRQDSSDVAAAGGGAHASMVTTQGGGMAGCSRATFNQGFVEIPHQEVQWRPRVGQANGGLSFPRAGSAGSTSFSSWVTRVPLSENVVVNHAKVEREEIILPRGLGDRGSGETMSTPCSSSNNNKMASGIWLGNWSQKLHFHQHPKRTPLYNMSRRKSSGGEGVTAHTLHRAGGMKKPIKLTSMSFDGETLDDGATAKETTQSGTRKRSEGMSESGMKGSRRGSEGWEKFLVGEGYHNVVRRGASAENIGVGEWVKVSSTDIGTPARGGLSSTKLPVTGLSGVWRKEHIGKY